MTIEQIAFFNHYHNGDLFHSKPFAADLVRQLEGIEFFYFHSKDVRTIMDLRINQANVENTNLDRHKHLILGEMFNKKTLFINTWIGSYFGYIRPDGECSLKFTYEMWKNIYRTLSDEFKLNVKIDNIEEYWPTIDYDVYNTEPVNSLVESNKDKKLVLICNGPGESGQCVFNTDLEDEIDRLTEQHPDVIFLITSKIMLSKKNIVYTGHITKVFPDLNEISYLSQFCDIIIGRSSGPFCFSTTKININDPLKTLFCFGDSENDSYPYDMPTKATYIFHKYIDQGTLVNEISNLIQKI